MIEQALYKHLQDQASLAPYLAVYGGKMAIFNQEAPADKDRLWGAGSQYGRVVFAVDLQGDPERCMGGTLAVDVMCKENEQFPEVIEPIIRTLIHGYFFSNGTFTVAAQWKNTSYFTQPTDQVTGCTIAFELLGFPVLSTDDPNIIARINEWTSSRFEKLHVINHEDLPATAWRPTGDDSAVYWRLVTDNPAAWIPDTFQTIWRTATLRGHIFAKDNAAAATVARDITVQLYAEKRLKKPGETPIMVNRRNTQENAADPLRTGQVMVEATYGIIVSKATDGVFNNIYTERKESL